MKYLKAALLGLDKYLPETRISSEEIEERLKPTYEICRLPEGRLELMTGIKERGVWPRGTRPSELATKAAENLFKKSLHKKEEVDLLIFASVCRDFLEPSSASVVHSNLGLSPKAMIFDLSNACLGVINGVVMASELIERGSINKALIVSGENSGPLLEETIKQLNQKAKDGEINRKNIKKYIANLTIGSAATAILIGSREHDKPLAEITHAVVRTDSSANILCQGNGSPDSLMMETDSELLMEKGVKLAKETWDNFKEESNWSESDLSWVLTHQVGKAHEALTLKALNCEEVPTFRTYPTLGNTGSSALPVTLEQLLEDKTQGLRPGNKMALMGIGSGLTSIILGLNWKGNES
ncbi:MAG: 3-oxoacyl-ACP synthase III [Bacteriovoracaceae bacterium]|nr:3-oxoacyl-ACP synthase III [Bacteriovoracaceae bacterium]